MTEAEHLRSDLLECASMGIDCETCADILKRLAALGELHASVPPEHRALSSGRLGTPDRNHDCSECTLGQVTVWGVDGVWATGIACPHCAGCGELTAKGQPSPSRLRDRSDAAIRSEVSAARAAGKLGVR